MISATVNCTSLCVHAGQDALLEPPLFALK